MKYIITDEQKRLQRNVLWQFFRFIALGIKFFKLTSRSVK